MWKACKALEVLDRALKTLRKVTGMLCKRRQLLIVNHAVQNLWRTELGKMQEDSWNVT